MSSLIGCAVSKQPPPSPPPLIYIDTNIYFDLLSKNQTLHTATQRPRWESAKALFDAVNDNRVVLAASALIEAEVNCLAVVRDGDESVHELVRGWFRAPSTKWTDVDRFLARDAAKLAHQWHGYAAKNKSFGGADATHLAAAIRLKCGYLMTQDTGFPLGHTVDGVQVMLPDEVWPRTLLDEIEDQTAAAKELPTKRAKAALVGGPRHTGQSVGPIAALPKGKSTSQHRDN